jgi:hypothetical protein
MSTSRVALSGVLGLLGGYVDTICFVRFGVFTTTVTGNLVFIGRSVLSLADCPNAAVDADGRGICAANAGAEIGIRLAVIASHLSGVFAITVVQRLVPSRRLASSVAPILGLLVLSADLLPAAVWSVGMGGAITRDARAWAAVPIAMSMGASYFISSTAGGRLNASAFDTTSHSHKVVSACSCALGCGSPASKPDFRSLQSAAVVVGVFLGALLGAVALFFSPFCLDCDADSDDSSWLFVPAAVVLFALLRAHDAGAPAGTWPAGALTEPLNSRHDDASAAAPPC